MVKLSIFEKSVKVDELNITVMDVSWGSIFLLSRRVSFHVTLSLHKTKLHWNDSVMWNDILRDSRKMDPDSNKGILSALTCCVWGWVLPKSHDLPETPTAISLFWPSFIILISKKKLAPVLRGPDALIVKRKNTISYWITYNHYCMKLIFKSEPDLTMYLVSGISGKNYLADGPKLSSSTCSWYLPL